MSASSLTSAEAAARGNALDEAYDSPLAADGDVFPEDVRAALRRCDRPGHALNEPTPSERARKDCGPLRAAARRAFSALRLVWLLLRVVVAEVKLRYL